MEDCSTVSEIWKENSAKLKNFICNKVDHQTICEDILHDVFLKLITNEERIKLVNQRSSYLIKIAHNLVVDFYRKQKKSEAEIVDDSNTNFNEELSDTEFSDVCVMNFITRLPPIYSEALILTEINGISQKQFAEKLNLSYTAAKSRVQRARKMLKESILACCPYQFDKYGNIIGCCE